MTRKKEGKDHLRDRGSSPSLPSDSGRGSGTFASNRKAFYDYAILESFEAGLVLSGGEVKSVRAGMASIKEGIIMIEQNEMWLFNAHIPKWVSSSISGFDPLRKRKLLLHRKEIDMLLGKAREKHLTLIPLKIYGSRGRVKIQVGLCRGKKKFEKRNTEKERSLKRELHEEKRKYMV